VSNLVTISILQSLVICCLSLFFSIINHKSENENQVNDCMIIEELLTETTGVHRILKTVRGAVNRNY
jgi:hypothetical protein